MNNEWVWQTGSAPAAIAVLHVAARAELLDRPLPAIGKARFACLRHHNGTIIDEVVVTRLGDSLIEIACHGGPGMRAAVEVACVSHGLQRGTTTTESATWKSLSRASSPAAVAWLLEYGDASPPFLSDYLFRMPVILITGPANAGKSTLLNAWCGHQRALVSDIPGTTRDLITGQTLIGGWRCALIDSAGLRPAGDSIEQAGQALVEQARRTADLVLYLQPPGDDGGLPDDLIVSGKADLDPQHGSVFWSSLGADHLTVTQLLEQLGARVLARLGLPAMIRRPPH